MVIEKNKGGKIGALEHVAFIEKGEIRMKLGNLKLDEDDTKKIIKELKGESEGLSKDAKETLRKLLKGGDEQNENK